MNDRKEGTKLRGLSPRYDEGVFLCTRMKFVFVSACLLQIGIIWNHALGRISIVQEDNMDVPSISISSTKSPSAQIRVPLRYGNPNLTEPRRNHPHAGAIDELGNFDYVHDPTVLHQQPFSFSIAESERRDICAPVGEGPEGYGELGAQLFTGHLQVASLTEEEKMIKIFCAVYSYPGNNDQTEAIRQTWGRRCDGFMVASTETNHYNATVNLPHQGHFQGKYKGIWQKVRSIVAYFHDNFIDEYDYLYLCGDDTYLIAENLKAFLANQMKSRDKGGYFYTGVRTHPLWFQKQPDYDPNFFYMGGGAGYILNSVLVRAIVRDGWPTCRNQVEGSAEDVYMAMCLQETLNVTGVDSRDDMERDRFIQYDPLRRAQLPNKADRGLNGYVMRQNKWLESHHNWTAKYGIDSIAPFAISFHMVKPPVKMRRYDWILYRRRNYENVDCGTVEHS